MMTFDRLLPPATSCHRWGAKHLFSEALSLYLGAMRHRNLLTQQDKHLILLAAYGLARLDNYPLARVLIRLSFSDMTIDEMLHWTELARQAHRDTTCVVPF